MVGTPIPHRGSGDYHHGNSQSQCTPMHCIRDERGYTQMRDTTMRVDDTSFITSATASSGSGKEVVGPISAV